MTLLVTFLVWGGMVVLMAFVIWFARSMVHRLSKRKGETWPGTKGGSALFFVGCIMFIGGQELVGHAGKPSGRPTSDNFDIALMAAKASRITYNHKLAEEYKLSSDSLSFREIKNISGEPQFALKLTHGSNVFIAFRGTQSPSDWWTNLNVKLTSTDVGWVHQGFYAVSQLFLPQVDEWIADARAEGKSVWITGHSMGGAVALLTALRANSPEGNNPVKGLITFGQPAVGLGKKFGAAMRERLGVSYGRYVNKVDMVPDIISRFSHGGWLIYSSVDDGIFCGVVPSKVLFKDGWLGQKESGADWNDHAMEQYEDLIENLSGQAVHCNNSSHFSLM